MAACENYLDIDADPQRVWDFISDFGNWGKPLGIKSPLAANPDLNYTFRLPEGSVPGVDAWVVMSQDPDTYGTMRRGSREKPLAWRILEWTPLNAIALGTERAGWFAKYTAAIAFTMEPLGQLSTRVGFASDLDSPGGLMMQLLYPQSRLQKKAEEQAKAVLARLKEELNP
ncbi:MAG: SRPBCC family protein [Elusimicrobia bacterium]|nr:SRPBCC family protein [Elusimicrobiota bacterium]